MHAHFSSRQALLRLCVHSIQRRAHRLEVGKVCLDGIQSSARSDDIASPRLGGNVTVSHAEIGIPQSAREERTESLFRPRDQLFALYESLLYAGRHRFDGIDRFGRRNSPVDETRVQARRTESFDESVLFHEPRLGEPLRW